MYQLGMPLELKRAESLFGSFSISQITPTASRIILATNIVSVISRIVFSDHGTEEKGNNVDR